MTEDDECKHGLLNGTCSLCLGKPVTSLYAEKVIRAQFDGRCPECGDQIHEGDAIGLVGTDWICCWEAA